MERRVAHARVLVVGMLHQQLRHLIDVLPLVRILHSLLDGSEGCVLRLPGFLRGEAPNEREERRAHAFHAHCLDDTVYRLLAGVVELVGVLLTFLVVHALGPGLEIRLCVIHLVHHVHAALQGDGRKRRQALCQPLWFLLAVGHKPLQAEAADAILDAFTRLDERGHELCRLHAVGEILLEEIGLHLSDVGHRLQALLKQLLVMQLRKLLQNLVQDSCRGNERGPRLLLHLLHDLANEKESGHLHLHLLAAEGVLQHGAELGLGPHDLLPHGVDKLLEQPDGALAGASVRVC
mmetsp:Transcript_68176/g.202880  ORF Transcript_68176/g.202880 Transcript_68176/m.202880 type:complete len:292 (+) Transcript_68176:434-1309(+)